MTCFVLTYAVNSKYFFLADILFFFLGGGGAAACSLAFR